MGEVYALKREKDGKYLVVALTDGEEYWTEDFQRATRRPKEDWLVQHGEKLVRAIIWAK